MPAGVAIAPQNGSTEAANFACFRAAPAGPLYRLLTEAFACRAPAPTRPNAGSKRRAPIVVLVEPQLGENIGAAARAMANFGLSRLRLVKPLQGWPNEKARVMAAGADRVLDARRSLRQPAGCHRRLYISCLATTARDARPGQARDRAGAGRPPKWRRGWRRGRHVAMRVRARAQRPGERRGGARRRDRHSAGQSGVRVAQSGAGGGDRRL